MKHVLFFALLVLCGRQGIGQEQMSDPVERSVVLHGNLRIKYVEQGDATGVPVIFLHGYSDSWRSYQAMLPYLPASIHAFAISQRGHGNSDRPDGSYDPKVFAADLAAFIEQLKIGPAIIVGHSMGATIAQRFVLDYPQLTQALVLAGSFAAFTGNPGVDELGATINQLSDPVDPFFISEFQKSTITKPIPEDYLETLIGESMKLPAHVWKGVYNGLKDVNYLSELRKVNKPVLLIWGDRDGFIDRQDQDQLLQSLRTSRLLAYKDVGHAVQWEEPQRFAKDITRFIAELANYK